MPYANDLPVGAVLPTLSSFNTTNILNLARVGYYFCDGSLLYADSNQELAAAIKTGWGGAANSSGGVSKFNVPPLTGSTKPLFIRGIDPTGQWDPEVNDRIAIAPGGSVGPNAGSYQDHATAAPTQGNGFITDTGGAHSHTCTGIGDYHRHYRGSNAPNELEDSDPVTLNNAGAHIHLLGGGYGSGGNPTTAPIAISLNWIIKQST
jgi:hypothetical protein